MRSSPVVFAVLLGAVFGVLTASLSKALRYQAPDECKWLAVTSEGEKEVTSSQDPDQEVALVCHLRTINSELENTNFSVIQPQYTVRLRIECADMFYFQSSLTPGSFQTLTDLRDLSIEYCKVANLTAGAFRGLRQLKNLTLRTHNTDWSAMTLEVEKDAFTEELTLLERLDLSVNNIWSLPEAAFCPLHSLEYLNLTRNRIRDLEKLRFGSSPTFPTCGSSLKILDLSNNSIDAIPPAVFSKLMRLQDLNLQGNVISFIADHALDGLTSLSSLNLADNKLVTLPPELFSETREVRELHLQNNSINVLAPGLFNDLTELIILDLAGNELTDEWINTATFAGLLRLVVLNLSNNNIAKLESTVFRDLYSLQILRLEENSIQSIAENTFGSLSNLHTLILSYNKLTRIDSNTFNGLLGLNVLSLDSNLIEYIDPEALRNSTSLQDLHLNSNKLYDIPAVLNEVPQLQTLDLGDNQITEIFNTSFASMEKLVGLRLTENSISNVSKGVFDKMTALRILNLSSNKIQRVEAGSFDANTNLMAIRLDGNYITEINALFDKLPNLVWLNISENLLQWFDYAQIPTGLQWLDIHGNQIAELGNYYEIESQLHLTVFDASDNKLTDITGSAIPDSVEVLNLSNNIISKVQSYTFFKKPNLTRVELTGNQIKSLTQNSLRISTIPHDKEIPEFYIGKNPFQCDCTMQWLQQYQVDQERNKPRLMDLDSVVCKLLYNRVTSFVLLKEATPDQFLCQYDSNCFPFCHCCDFDACDCEMTCPTNCTCYHDLSWSANVVDCSRSGYVDNLPDRIPMDSTQLYLDGNDIRVVGSHSFIGRKKLQVLFLNNSNVEIIHNRTFNGLKVLELLRLDNNRISELKGYEFEGLESLRELYLQNNKITSIHNATFMNLMELRIVRLDHNRITHFAVWQLSSALVQISLSSNPWSCECEYTERFREYLHYTGSAVIDSADVRCSNNSLVLEDEPDVGFYLLRDNLTTCVTINITNFVESPPVNENYTSTTIIQHRELQSYLPLLIVTLVASSFIIVFTLIVFIYRQEMRVWFHSRFGVRLFYKTSEIEMDDRDKLFDAFVSYSSKDEAFVAEELAPMLENGDPPYKLCLHYREFPVNGYLADTIVQAVESSRRTIMVLSENFIKSEWCRFEFKSAHHQVLRDRRKRLIVILLGEVPQKDLDPDIRLYLKTNTYLQWGDKLFWEKLKFALPDVPNNQRTRSNHNNHVVHHHHHVHRHNNRNHNHNNHNNHSNHSNHSHHNNTNTSRSVAIHI
ncbi:toll-like receptor Tollo [Macrosteles quadrilineatus]|uniref:toll-like receptor Tollo n=1 Tax=Macrosteles quadrilineatus TaxID=74068 RepID=UPI0023E31DBE|nr:toll-like receptor Tollo [Macrosteles quadrilineatus]